MNYIFLLNMILLILSCIVIKIYFALQKYAFL